MDHYEIVKVTRNFKVANLTKKVVIPIIFDLTHTHSINSIFLSYCLYNRDKVILASPNSLIMNVIKILDVRDMLIIAKDLETAKLLVKNLS